MTEKDKREILNKILKYYKYHIEGFHPPGSPEVLMEVFRG
jgi:hypothetical protein